MPTPGKPSGDIMLLIGQLLEAAKAASDGLKSTNLEIQANGKALIAAVKTLELIEETVAELDRVVRTGNGDSLVTRLAMLRVEVKDLQEQVCALEKRAEGLHTQISSLDSDRQKVVGGKHLLWVLAGVLAWLVTTGVAVYAAVGQWAGVKP